MQATGRGYIHPPRGVQQPPRGHGQARGGNGMGCGREAPSRGIGYMDVRQLTLFYAHVVEWTETPQMLLRVRYLSIMYLILH